MMHKLYYISQGNSNAEHLNNIDSALKAGVKMIQLRLKNISEDEYISVAEFAFKKCLLNHALLIINDNINVAKQINAHGVHLGLNDTSVEEARKVLGNKIIGGTANTVSEVQSRIIEGVDYIGLGPYKFTTTKERLSPVLGLEGIRNLIKSINTTIPVYAIGGIQENDMGELMETGIYGIAVSGLITNHLQKEKLVSSFQTKYSYVENR